MNDNKTSPSTVLRTPIIGTRLEAFVTRSRRKPGWFCVTMYDTEDDMRVLRSDWIDFSSHNAEKYGELALGKVAELAYLLWRDTL